MHTTTRTWAEIHLDHLAHNYRELKNRLPESCRLMAPVKANAYGHGAVPISRLLQDLGADYLAVACVAEALELREAGIRLPILNIGYAASEDAEVLAQNHITQTVFSLEMAEKLSRALQATSLTLPIHIELDSGLGRLGFPCRNLEPEDAKRAMLLPHLDIQGLFTHFSVADSDCDDYTLGQKDYFTQAVDWLEAETHRQIPLRHLAASGAILRLPETHCNMVRPGISLYGLSPNPELIEANLRPVMTLRTRIIQVRPFAKGEFVSYGRTHETKSERTIAVIPIGYADGLHRGLSGKMEMLLHGQRVSQVGRICMDFSMLDVTGPKKISVGDEVTVFGTDGDKSISVAEHAARVGTISYELLCAVSPRVPRMYSPRDI